MKIKNQCQIEARSAEIWDLFLDPEALRAAIPGCKSIELVGEDEYRAYLSLGISAIRGNYSGTVKIRDKVPTSSYRMIVEGNSSVGFAKGEGTIILEEQDASTTVLYDFDGQVGGKIAGVGQRMLGGVAKFLADQFFRSMKKQLKKQEEGSA